MAELTSMVIIIKLKLILFNFLNVLPQNLSTLWASQATMTATMMRTKKLRSINNTYLWSPVGWYPVADALYLLFLSRIT